MQTGSHRAKQQAKSGPALLSSRQAVTEQQTGCIGAACRQEVIEQNSRKRVDRW
jgi:hypothetical protein